MARVKDNLKGAVDSVGKTAMAVTDKTKDMVNKTKDTVFNAIDMDGDGDVDIEDVIIMGLGVPGVKVNREDFFRKEFANHFSEDVIKDAIANNPVHAKIPTQEIDKIANEVIKFERTCVSGISAALNAPGGVAMAATIPADIAQYYGYMLRAAQKLMYLYGFPEIDVENKDAKIDSATMNTLIICLGVMYGVAGANKALNAIAKALATGVEKKLLNAALTKGTIYPIVKSVAKWFGKNMTKQVFAGFFKKAIPVVGGVVGGGITYFSFKPCCDKLQDALKNTMLNNPNNNADDDTLIIDVEADVIETE